MGDLNDFLENHDLDEIMILGDYVKVNVRGKEMTVGSDVVYVYVIYNDKELEKEFSIVRTRKEADVYSYVCSLI